MAKRAERQRAAPAAEATTDSTRKTSAGYARIMALQNRNVGALMRLHLILQDAAIAWTNDMLDFAGQHCKQQLEGPGRQLGSAVPPVASHLRHVQMGTEQYLDHVARFLALAAKLSRESRVHLENHATAMLNCLGEDDGLLITANNTNEPSTRVSADRGGNQP